jgi:UDP-3-O-[3-hydroxymyristoyl] glucosamine N-acyltransferase LpxD
MIAIDSTAGAIARQLQVPYTGEDFPIRSIASADRAVAHALVFLKKPKEPIVQALNALSCVLVITNTECAHVLKTSVLVVDNPRLVFAKAVTALLGTDPVAGVHRTAVVAATARIGKGVTIGAYCVIEDDVEIGDYTVLRNHVTVSRNCRIGRRCLIKSGAVIGEKGFGFEFELDGTPYPLPHAGGVVIGDHCEVGSVTTIVGGTIEPTRLMDHCKIDDHVHIAHNVTIGRRAFVIACAEVSGSVRIGDDAWIAPNASILESLTVGPRALVGLGAVVNKDVPPNTIVVGNPGKILRDRFPSAAIEQ